MATWLNFLTGVVNIKVGECHHSFIDKKENRGNDVFRDLTCLFFFWESKLRREKGVPFVCSYYFWGAHCCVIRVSYNIGVFPCE